ncbi:phosphopyruvate hydratase [Anaplasma platys]|uniref:phosphopyruvate hydratase n=1 Tax=Anaplasma platys TaxID=949 RepID=UPI00145F5C33|nr:phosphopyruvate hydratase [Anaplasma platys]
MHNKCAVTISSVFARQVLDSRGRPTVEAVVTLSDGSQGMVSAPSGASVGKLEALELRDKDPASFFGYGVARAVENVNSLVSSALIGETPFDQATIDDCLISLDGTENKSKLGANATIAVSIACAKAAANSLGVPLYRYLGGVIAKELPIPLVNVINGGVHADNGLDFQEFMIVPIGADKFSSAMKMCAEVFLKLKEVLRNKGFSTNTGDEGGFAPEIDNNEKVFEILLESIESAGYKPYDDVALALDVASSTFYNGDSYSFSGSVMSSEELVSYYEDIVDRYPIVSIEDGMAEEDVQGWERLTTRLGEKVQLVGDDLFVTNPELIEKYIGKGLANAVLIKPNQVGTLSETLKAVRISQKNDYATIVSHRSGETEDASIAHIAVALNSGQIKTGSMSRSERIAKYNELLRIEESLGKGAVLHKSL